MWKARYYASIAACIVARKQKWIRSACLAAALLFPAVAALHGIVLACLHTSGEFCVRFEWKLGERIELHKQILILLLTGAVDMDVYGAFQLCAIGILTAPLTVRLSKTYFESPGRDLISLWTVLLLAGLVSLTVEFIRLSPTICPPDDPASISWHLTGNFYYNSTCSMTCGEAGPFSPLRQGAANNIYVIPAPYQLTFNAATLLAAACCIPAILCLVSVWIKILEKNWENFAGKGQVGEGADEEPIMGTNGITPKQMSEITKTVWDWLQFIEIPIFTAAVLAIMIKGEMNFFSGPVDYQTEPIQSIGEWSCFLLSVPLYPIICSS